jgi:RNA polymerase sigma-54 factor
MNYQLKQDLKQTQNIKQLQRLIMTPQMQQALNLLQLPIMELSTLVETEIEQNPLLESNEDNSENMTPAEMEIEEQEEELKSPLEKELNFNENDFQILKQLDEDFKDHFKETQPAPVQRNQDDEKLQTFLENSLRSDETLYECLMRQTREILSGEEDINIAEAIIGNLDGNGLLLVPIEEIAILNQFDTGKLSSILLKIQELDPPGIAATSIQQALLLQMERKKKQNSLAYKIIDSHFQDLLHNRIPAIQKSLHCSLGEINLAIINDIAKLDLHPGSAFIKEFTQPIVPDLSITHDDSGKLHVVIIDEYLPTIRLNQRYLKMLEDVNIQNEAKEFIKQKLMSAKWLVRNIYQRNETLEKIGNFLIKEQADFFSDPKGNLVPLNMKTLAEAINVHESTVARAVSNKYLTCNRGIFLLKYFFTNELDTDNGSKISSKTVKDLVNDTIQNEDKKKPLSDQEISNMIKLQGIHCARRTVAKYRHLLKFGNAHQRKKFR